MATVGVKRLSYSHVNSKLVTIRLTEYRTDEQTRKLFPVDTHIRWYKIITVYFCCYWNAASQFWRSSWLYLELKDNTR